MSFFSRKSAASTASSSSTSIATGPPTKEIYTVPPEGVKPTKKWEYDEAQLKQIEELKKYTASITLPETDEYYPWEARFLADPGTHPRYMRASKWKIDNAKTRIKGTIEWRREFKPELIQPDDVSVEAETGKIILSGFDADARPIIYMRPGRENTETSPRQIRHLIFCLERAIDLMPPGQEQTCIIVDYKSATSQSNPSISTGRKVLNILQNHYVERLGRGLVINMPWWINAFFSGIGPLMDPITRDKIRFNPKLTDLIPPNQVDHEYGGEYNFEFDHKVYWKTLVEFCHLAQDGGRLDAEGKSCVPPAGNGAKAAFENLVPKSGAVATGQLTANGAPDATSGAPTSHAQDFAEAHRETLVNGDAKEDAAEAKEANGTNGVEVIANGLNVVSLEEPPATTTKPGPPESEAKFDHPPTEAEKQAVN